MNNKAIAGIVILGFALLFAVVIAADQRATEARCLNLAQQYIIHDLERSLQEKAEGPGAEQAAEWADITVYCDLIISQEATIARLQEELEGVQ